MSATPSAIAACAWSRKPPPPCPGCSMRAREEVADHPLLALIERPNPLDTSVSFIEAICANLLLYGNAYIESVLLDGQLRELYALRPDRMSVERRAATAGPRPSSIARRARKRATRCSGEGIEPILHIKLFQSARRLLRLSAARRRASRARHA